MRRLANLAISLVCKVLAGCGDRHWVSVYFMDCLPNCRGAIAVSSSAIPDFVLKLHINAKFEVGPAMLFTTRITRRRLPPYRADSVRPDLFERARLKALRTWCWARFVGPQFAT